MADPKAVLAFLRLLSSADFFKERAILWGSLKVKTLLSKSRAIECLVTSPDHFLLDIVLTGNKANNYSADNTYA